MVVKTLPCHNYIVDSNISDETNHYTASLTRKHFSRMYTADFSDSLYRGPLDKDPQTETPLQRPPRQRPWTKNPWKEHGARNRDWLEGTWDQAARQEVTSYRDPLWTEWQTRVKTLPCCKLRLRPNKHWSKTQIKWSSMGSAHLILNYLLNPLGCDCAL